MNRALGRDGLSLEFYKTAWPLIGDDLCRIINSMFFDRAITPQQKLGTMVCLPNSGLMLTPADCRPITLLNCDSKILTRILARPLLPMTPTSPPCTGGEEENPPHTTHNENLPIRCLVLFVSRRTQMYAGRYTTSLSTIGHIVLCTTLTCISSCHKYKSLLQKKK